jgi:hypothetical protein
MPSLKTAAITAGILIVALWVIVKFAPATFTADLGLNKPAA